MEHILYFPPLRPIKQAFLDAPTPPICTEKSNEIRQIASNIKASKTKEAPRKHDHKTHIERDRAKFIRKKLFSNGNDPASFEMVRDST